MKILITTDWYMPVVNGVDTSVMNLANGLREMGHEVRILTLSETRHSHVDENVTYIGAARAGVIYPDARLQMARAAHYMDALIRWRPDVVHSQCEFSTFHLALRIATACGVPLVHTYHTIYEDYTHYFSPSVRVGKAVVARLSRHVLNRTDAVIVPSEKTRSLLTSYGVRVPITVVPTGISLERYSAPIAPERLAALRSALDLSEGDRVLLVLGRLAKEKSIDRLFHMLAAEKEAYKLVVVGDGPEHRALEALATQLGMRARVRFTGMVSPEETPVYYHLADVFISASQSETQGLTYMEAMASGLPLLCADDRAISDLIHHGVNGLLYRDNAGFHTGLAALFAGAERRRAIGRAAQMTALSRYSIEAFVGRVLGVYQSTLQEARAAAFCLV